MSKNSQRFLKISLSAGLALSAVSTPTADAVSSNIPENPMVDPQGPALTSTDLNRAQETTLIQGVGHFVFSSIGTQSPGNCHLVPMSHQQVFCTIATGIHYTFFE